VERNVFSTCKSIAWKMCCRNLNPTASRAMASGSATASFSSVPGRGHVVKGIQRGRARWQIEHKQRTVSMVFSPLNLAAFMAHIILECGDRRYQRGVAMTSRREL
jgi:hypothetical protein